MARDLVFVAGATLALRVGGGVEGGALADESGVGHAGVRVGAAGHGCSFGLVWEV